MPMIPMNITDIICDTLLQLLDENNGTIQIQRNNLASQIGCVPSQINYVITSRFTKEQGYVVQSRRGGGGYIEIVKLDHSNAELIIHIINTMGDAIDEATARILINSLHHDGFLSESQVRLMLSAVDENNFKGLIDMGESSRRIVRANLIKSMLVNTIL